MSVSITQENQKFLARLTAHGISRKIKCVEDIFNALCESYVIENKIMYNYKPVACLYKPQLRDIADHSRENVKVLLSSLLSILSKECNEENIIASISNLIDVIFLRNKSGELVYFSECIPILLLFGLDLQNYFYGEFML